MQDSPERYNNDRSSNFLNYIKIPIGLTVGLLFSVNSSVNTVSVEAASSETILYEVKPDDTLSSAAQSSGKKINEVAKLNGITDANNIQSGQILVLEGSEDRMTGQIADQTIEDFIESVGRYASQVAEENGLYASVMIAQAILESGYGNSTLSSVPFHNLFGIKGSYDGDSVVMATSEYLDEHWIYPNERFRSYPNYKASLLDNAQVLRYGNTWDRQYYSGAWVENTNSYFDATAWLEGRYATDPSYSKKLNQLINRYDLTRFDSVQTQPVTTASTSSNPVATTSTSSDPVITTSTTSSNKVEDDTATDSDIDYNTYTVEHGDTLFNIAKRHGMTVSELQQINNLSGHHISLGEKLNVTGTLQEENVNTGTHTVAPGDTLYNISNRYGMTVSELQQLNGIESTRILLGQNLDVNSPSQVENSLAHTHTVEPNDTLYNISNRYGMTVAELQQLNNLETNHITIGQTLKVSGESVTIHTVSAGETIYSIANHYGLTVAELKAKNHLTSDVIKTGQELYT